MDGMQEAQVAPQPQAGEAVAWFRGSADQITHLSTDCRPGYRPLYASPQPANPAPSSSTTSENPTRENDMSKLTSKVALELVTRIEKLNDQIIEAYREANEYDGINNSNVIRDIVKAREEAADQKCIADGFLEALDLDEDEE